ncbi:unnamed protein product [Diatraea saccharalis]|uniref:Uncharacterized protein n=1 Tax=Diatraea saccharalis TaxID=40085 RepID=A0A9N9R569_9NEOP|nr:unnamed protein product [Diatraea saccharalis]
MAALHAFLSATTITQNDFLFVHNYVKNSGNGALKRFWSVFLPSVADLVFDLDPEYWATNNVIFSSEDDQSTSMHLLSMADDTGLPSFAGIRLSTAGKRASVYIVAEGVASNMYKRMHNFDETEMSVEKLIDLLKSLKIWALKTTEDVSNLILK